MRLELHKTSFVKVSGANVNGVEGRSRGEKHGFYGVEGHGRGAVGGFNGVGTVFGGTGSFFPDTKSPAGDFGGAVF